MEAVSFEFGCPSPMEVRHSRVSSQAWACYWLHSDEADHIAPGQVCLNSSSSRRTEIPLGPMRSLLSVSITEKRNSPETYTVSVLHREGLSELSPEQGTSVLSRLSPRCSSMRSSPQASMPRAPSVSREIRSHCCPFIATGEIPPSSSSLPHLFLSFDCISAKSQSE